MRFRFLNFQYFFLICLSYGVGGCEKFGSDFSSTDNSKAYEINGKAVSLEEVQKKNQGMFYDLEKKKFELIRDVARKAYLDDFFAQLASQTSTSIEDAKKSYLKKAANVTDSQVAETLGRVANHPNLANLSDDEKKAKIREALEDQNANMALEGLINTAIQDKKLAISYPEPSEPRFPVVVEKHDIVRFGPDPQDVKPITCRGDDCAITIVEYSEFQCPFCSRTLPVAKELLSQYKGKIRWVVRSFPLDFHQHARVAAYAALCANEQNRYWEMYQILFENQASLEREKIIGYAKDAGLESAPFAECLGNKTRDFDKIIDAQMKVAKSYGVSGTPAFFINGRRTSGAMPVEVFVKMIEEELATKK